MSCSCIVIQTAEGTTVADAVVPQHAMIRDPFRAPLMYGKSFEGCRTIGCGKSTVMGTFVGVNGCFLPMDANTFLIFTPQINDVTLGQCLFPHHTTHTVLRAEAYSMHKIIEGSIIVAYSQNYVHAITVFVRNSDVESMFEQAKPFMLKSANYIVNMGKTMRGAGIGWDVEKFKTLEQDIPVELCPPAAKRAKTESNGAK